MVKRSLVLLALTFGLAGGTLAATHAPLQASAQRAQFRSDLRLLTVEPQTAETEVNAPEAEAGGPCVTDATGTQVGDCQGVQSAVGTDDRAGDGSEGAALAPDADNVQAGDQSSAD